MSETRLPRPRTLRDLVERLGIPEEDIERAQADGTLGLLAMSYLLLPEQPEYDMAEVAAHSGLTVEEVRQFWRALGFPDPRDDERIFTDVDVEMLRTVDNMLDLGLVEPRVALQMARVIGSSVERIATAQIDAIEERVDDDAPADPALPEPAVMRAGVLLPMMPKILEYTWRRHLQVAARRRMVREASTAGSPDADAVAVGFADLVGFTAMSQQISGHELAVVVDRFESLAYDTVVAWGGRVVKMIGDEVMFAVDDVRVAVAIALMLAEAYHDDESLSDVRVGLAHGPVLSREGDLFGPTVNLASRIVNIAFPGSVVVSDEVHVVLADDPDLAWRSLRTRYLKDIGRVALWVVRRASEGFERERPVERARRRRGELKNLVAEKLLEDPD